MQRSYQLSVEIRRNEKAMARQLINVNKECHCHKFSIDALFALTYASEYTGIYLAGELFSCI